MRTLRRSLIGLFIVALVLTAYFVMQREEPLLADSPSIHADSHRAETATDVPAEFPAAELRSALNDVCLSDASDPDEREWTQEEIQLQFDAFREQRRVLSTSLSESRSSEHLYLAALLADDPESRYELLDAAVTLGPTDPFLLWGAVQICSEQIESTPCPLGEWERRLISLDGQNSESWVRVAANRYAMKDHQSALEALRHASTAAETRAYWTETIEMTERGLAAGSDLGFPERAGMAFGLAASELPRYGDYVRMCEERSAQSVDWAYACLAYGELVENQGKTEMGVSIARSIQKVALESLGEVDKATEVQQRAELRRQEMLESIKDYNPAVERLIFSNPTLFSTYLAAIRSEGELAAQQKITSEVERLIEQQPELSCEQVLVR